MRKYAACLALCMMALIVPVAAQSGDSLPDTDAVYDAAPPALRDALDTDTPDPSDIQSMLSYEKLFDFLSDNLVSTLKGSLSMVSYVAALLIVTGLYETLSSSFDDKGTRRLLDFACAAAAAGAVCPALYEMIGELSASCAQLSQYLEISAPVLTGLMAASGNVSRAAITQLVLFNASALTGGLLSSVLVPLTGTYVCIGIASCVAGNDGMRSLATGMRHLVSKGIFFVSAAFTFILSLQTAIGGASDGLSRRALKLAVGSFLPLTGGVMSESVDAFLGSVSVIRSAAGVFSIIVVVYIIIIPVIKMAANYLALKLTCLVADMMGGGRVGGMLAVAADAYGLLIAAACGVMVIFVICLSIVLLCGGQ